MRTLGRLSASVECVLGLETIFLNCIQFSIYFLLSSLGLISQNRVVHLQGRELKSLRGRVEVTAALWLLGGW